MKQGWEIKKLGEVCDVIGGGTPSKRNSKFYDGNIFWATVRDMKGDFIKDTEHKITEEAIKNSSTNIIPKGNVVIATRVGLGKICLLENDTAINQDLRGIIPKKVSVLSVGYLFQWLKSISHLIAEEGTGATVQGVKLPFIKNLQIPFPPLPEQQRIVSILDEAFAAIAKAKANAEQNLKNAKELFESYLQGVFENKGEAWEENSLREVCLDFLQGINTATDKTVFVDDGIPIFQAKEIGLNKLDMSNTKFIALEKYGEVAERYKPKEGDILYNNIGSSMGRSILVDWGFPFTIAWNVMRIIPNRKIMLPKFLNYILQSPSVYNNILFKAKGVGMPFISKKDLIEIMVSYPNIFQQKAIVQKLDVLSVEAKKLEAIYRQKLDDLEELKKSILQKAFNGELKTS